MTDFIIRRTQSWFQSWRVFHGVVETTERNSRCADQTYTRYHCLPSRFPLSSKMVSTIKFLDHDFVPLSPLEFQKSYPGYYVSKIIGPDSPPIFNRGTPTDDEFVPNQIKRRGCCTNSMGQWKAETTEDKA